MNPISERVPIVQFETGVNNPKNSINSIHQDVSGRIWMQTEKGTLNGVLLDDFGLDLTPPFNQKNALFYMNFFCEGNDSILWISSPRRGLLKADLKTNEIELFEKKTFFKESELRNIYLDKTHENYLWIATQKGICHYNHVTRDTFWVYPEKSKKTNSVLHLKQDVEGNIWFKRKSNLGKYDIASGELKLFGTGYQEGDYLFPSDFFLINSLLYTTFTHHFGYINTNTEEITIFEADLKPKVGKIIAMEQDGEGNLWFASHTQLFKFDTKKQEFSFFRPNDSNTYFRDWSSTLMDNGEIYFGTTEGLVIINPSTIVADTTDFKLVLSEVRALNKPIKFEESIEFVDELHFSFEESRSFALSFTALNFTNHHKIKYQYKLEGIDKDWSKATDLREAEYTSLPHGSYVFKVRVYNGNRKLSSKQLNIPIVIAPPFYHTWWFYTLIALIGLLILYLVVLNRKRTIQLKKEKNSAERNAHYKTKFLSNMSHEIRTPMNGIMGLNKLMMESVLDDKQKRYVEAINLSCENLLWIINDILDQAKLESGKFSLKSEPFELRAIIEQVGTLLSHKIQEKNLVYSSNVNHDVPQILIGDGTRLFQVITNLVGNAIKFTEKGSVTLNAYCEFIDEENITFYLEVLDTGIGIPQDKLDSIFQTFEQLSGDSKKNNFVPQGTGLGLSIAKEIVELQNGKIGVRSKQGKGTTFFAKIPYLVGTDLLQKSKDRIVEMLPSGLNILLVEDNQINQFLCIEVLKKDLKDVKIEVAENGAIALSKIQDQQYDLVLMDVQRPVMDGNEATKAIRNLKDKYYQTVPILGLTASAIKEQIQQSIDAGMNDCSTKPINTLELFSKIKKLTND